MQFRSKKQANECLKYWQKILYLEDWHIVVLMCKPDYFKHGENQGEIEFSMLHKAATISIVLPEYYGNRILKYCAEQTLIHELLHCKYNWCQAPDTFEGIYTDNSEHALLEQMARSLIMTKYGLNKNWFYS